jgi:hypothetical protein
MGVLFGERLSAVNERDDISSSLSEVFSYIDRCMDYLIKKKREDAAWLGLLSAAIIFFIGIIGVAIVNIFTEMSATNYFIEHPDFIFVYLTLFTALSTSIGLLTYFWAKKKYAKEYVPWKKTLTELKKKFAEGNSEGENLIETTLKLIDQTNLWFLDVMKYKSQEALTYGLIAFLITAPVSLYSNIGLPIAVVIGIIVWFYFRNEKRKEAAQEIQRFNAYKKKFEDGKDFFLETLGENPT